MCYDDNLVMIVIEYRASPQTLVENSIFYFVDYAMFSQNPFITLSLKVRVSFKPPREHNGISFMKVTHIQDSRGRLPLIFIYKKIPHINRLIHSDSYRYHPFLCAIALRAGTGNIV